MHATQASRPKAFIDGSRLITEACVRAGADVFVGYPITPANLLYLYANKRYPTMLAAPDEITTLQWMTGFAATGRIPVTATSFPGYALMVESINMAYMMELPMVVILVQRLGPATGTATCGAQGDLSVVQGTLSGGFTLPTLCISSIDDCWELPAKAVETAVKLRTPVVLLTSKEMVMTMLSYDWSKLRDIQPVKRLSYKGDGPYLPYITDDSLIPEFLPVSQTHHQVRLTASTHDTKGILQNVLPEAIENTKRLEKKLERHLGEFTFFELDEQEGADRLIVSYDISAQASREALQQLRRQGKKVSMLVAKTLLPVPKEYIEIVSRYPRVVVVEENLKGQLRHILFGAAGRKGVTGVNGIAKMISPTEIIEEVLRDE
jgi:2-oxoglutarate ferredoxin oxidoreductase subunit alpha